MKKDTFLELIPERYKIMPFLVPLDLENYTHFNGGYTLSLKDVEANDWFKEFYELVYNSTGTKYLPICRLSDGEYKFLFGDVGESERVPFVMRIFLFFKRKIYRTIYGRRFKAQTLTRVSSGNYSFIEVQKSLNLYIKHLKTVSETGILALHLTFGSKPFQEQFHPHLKKLFQKHNILLNVNNFFPFYFVYVLLSGEGFKKLINNRRVLIISGANSQKFENVKASLFEKGAFSVDTLKISSERSLFDKIDIVPYIGNVDICFVAAGIGKPNILTQLAPLHVPCIDVGYMFEVWNDKTVAARRPFCLNDLDRSKLQ